MSDDNQLSNDSIGRFIRSLNRHYPNASGAELNRIGNEIIQGLTSRIEEGYHPAVARPNFDGSMDVIVLTIEKLRKGGR